MTINSIPNKSLGGLIMAIEKMKRFINSTPNSSATVLNVAMKLKENGYVELMEQEKWTEDIKGRSVFVIRGSSIIAISLPKMGLKGFIGTLTHSDSPTFRIKANPEMNSNGYTKLNVEPYGSPIYYSWLDKPLSICGTVVDEYGYMCNVDTGDDLQVFIPSQAIHMNREVNKKCELNPQIDMLPVYLLNEQTNNSFDKQFIKAINNNRSKQYKIEKILAKDICLYNPEKVKLIKLCNSKDSIVIGPRLDNLISVWASYEAMIGKQSITNAFVTAIFNSEEIGSATFDGANGTFLNSVLERICDIYEEDKYKTYANSMFLSIDAAHAIHPNAEKKSDPTNKVKLGQGIVIKHNDTYATNIQIEAYIKAICLDEKICCQDFYSRSDMKCGSTLGNISMSRHGIPTQDIGIPMLAMHSAVETVSKNDCLSLLKFLEEFYKTY